MYFLEQLFSAIINFLEWAISSLLDILLPKPPPIYPAQFISSKKLLKKKHQGFNLTGTKQLSLEHSTRNVLLTGSTGTGKSSVVLLPTLYTMKGSFVVHDPSGELYQRSAGYLRSQGYTIKVLNFSDLSSDGYNPLARAVTSADINKVASLLIRTALAGNTDPFWNQQAITLLSIIIHLVKTQKTVYKCLAGVRYFLTVLRVNPNELETYIKHIPHHEIYLEYQAFLNLEEKVKAGVVATVLAALQIVTDATVARVTAHDSIDFNELRKKPTAIFIQNPVADQNYYTTITSIFIEQLMSHVLRKLPTARDLPLALLIDEASSLYLPSLSIVIANVRKYQVAILLALQDFSQLTYVYGREQAETIKANCFSKLYFTGQPLGTAIELEQSLGVAPRVDGDGQEIIRPLLPREELRTMKTNQALLVCGNHQPMMVKLTPYYKSYTFLKYSQYPAPARPAPTELGPLPTLSQSLYDPPTQDHPTLPKQSG